jgi:hypothetical protein
MNAVDVALTALLRGDSALAALVTGSYNQHVPNGVVLPYVVFENLGDVPQYAIGALYAWQSSYQLRVIAEGNTDASTTILARLVQLLGVTATPLTVTGYAQVSQTITRYIPPLVELSGGVLRVQLGLELDLLLCV